MECFEVTGPNQLEDQSAWCFSNIFFFGLQYLVFIKIIKKLHRVLLCAVDKRSDCGAGAYLIEERYDLYLLDLKVWTQTFLITINFQIKLISITLWHSLESPNCNSYGFFSIFIWCPLLQWHLKRCNGTESVNVWLAWFPSGILPLLNTKSFC